MLSIIQDIPDFVLSSQLDIVIGADKQVTFSLNKGGSVILQETYTPDSKNQVHILDLFSLMEPYLLTTPLSQFSYTCSASGETSISKTFTVLLSQYLILVTATYFVKNYFLTALAGRDKITAMNRKETLYITMGVVDASFIVPVSAECIYSDDNNNINKVTRNIGFSFRGDISSIDVSPSLFAKDGYKLLRYTITAGVRRQVYRLDHDAPDSIGIKFRNSYGCMETFYFRGIEKVEPELTRSAAWFNGTYRTYYIDEQRKHTLSTGYIPETMFTLVDDVARSQDVYLIDNTEEIPITIIESDTERDSSDNGLFSFSITYIPSSRCQNRLKLLPDIFDDTFDDTYN